MKVIIFGASGMVGQGVLRECLLAKDVELAQTVGRTPVTQVHPKLRQVLHTDFLDYSSIAAQLKDFDACFYCLGISSSGVSEDEYTRVTYKYALDAAHTLARLNPQMTFVFVSGAGTDSSGKGRVMWARVKGKTENALLHLPFKAVYLFRPGIIRPLYGIHSKTPAYRLFYFLTKPILPLAKWLFPNTVLTTEEIGRAMLEAVRQGASQPILETSDIAKLSNYSDKQWH